ncbi:MAG: energy transducer TonB [Flavobacteriales bacterium]|nr:energy transducer TonB [Flavobacteriales bacterium]
MKILPLLFIVFSFHSTGQIAPPPELELPSPEPVTPWNDSIIQFINYPEPEYPGGIIELRKHIQSYDFNPDWLDSFPQKRGYVSCIVEADGRLMDIKVVRGISPELDDVMLRIVEEMPRWIPARDNYGPVRMRIRFPIIFTRSEE